MASQTTGDAAPGHRYLYICEDGLVHYCSQQRGFPAIPLEKYTPDHLAHEYHTQKSCAPHCTVSCVQQVAMLDNWRSPQTRPAFVPVENLLSLPELTEPGLKIIRGSKDRVIGPSSDRVIFDLGKLTHLLTWHCR